MRLLKDSTKLKGILLAIDAALLVAVIVAAVMCGYWKMAQNRIPELDFEGSMEAYALQEQQMNGTLAELAQELQTDDSYLTAEKNQKEAEILAMHTELEQVQNVRDDLARLEEDVRDPIRMQDRIAQVRLEYGQAVRQLEDLILAGQSDYKICYLTFDDGPTYQTDKFLDELERLDVYATFFTIGNGIQEGVNVYLRDNALRREARMGHTIANHTYTHAYYGPLYVSVDTFMDAVREQDELVYRITGLHTDIVRFPSGSHYARYRQDTIQALLDEGYQWMDWISNAHDAGTNGFDSKHIASNVVWQVKQDKITVVLMHDWNLSTLGALNEIVTRLRAENYLFLPLFKESSTNGNCVPKWG